ncbi:hypothetical protein T492DRAFT_610604 [Pavlovales sp. CCMP2436]|nr:hypothetical protein T492DRAFT_610604 [Pavlovales sp. CCMP2436]
MLTCLLTLTLALAGRAPVRARPGSGRGTAAVRMDAAAAAAFAADVSIEAWAGRWRVVRLPEDAVSRARVEVSPSDVSWEAFTETVTIARSPESPGIGLVLIEAGEADGLGLVLIEGVAPGSNAAALSVGTFLPGDVIAAAGTPGGPSFSTEGITYDATVGVLSSLDPMAPVVLTLKRLRPRPFITVRLEFPQAEGRDDESVTLYSGMNLRRVMLGSGINLNDPLARRFDAGIGTGDCGGEGCCCTCAVDVLKGVEVLSAQGAQERQMLAKFPRWRLACKTSVVNLVASGEMVVRVSPRGFDGFYGKDERDANGKLQYRGL